MTLPRLLCLSLAGLTALFLAAPCHAQEGGTPIKVTTSLQDDGSRVETQKDIDNRRAESRTFSASNKLLHRWVYTLDDQGREVDGTCYDAKDKVLAQVSYKYDPFGHISEVAEKGSNGAVVRRTVYHRDASGKVLATDVLDANGNPVNPRQTPAGKKSRSR